MGGIDLTDLGPAASASGPCGAATAACLERREGRRRFFLLSFSASSVAEAAAAGGGGGAGMGTAAVCSPVALMMQTLSISSKDTRRGNPRSEASSASTLPSSTPMDKKTRCRGAGREGDCKEGMKDRKRARERGSGGGAEARRRGRGGICCFSFAKRIGVVALV
jgi:hypothetical protein